MNTASILIKTEPEIKAKAQKTAQDLGVSLSSLLNAFLKQFIKTKTVTFDTGEEKPSKYLIKLIKQAEEDLRKGNTSPKFDKAEDFIDYLHKHSA